MPRHSLTCTNASDRILESLFTDHGQHGGWKKYPNGYQKLIQKYSPRLTKCVKIQEAYDQALQAIGLPKTVIANRAGFEGGNFMAVRLTHEQYKAIISPIQKEWRKREKIGQKSDLTAQQLRHKYYNPHTDAVLDDIDFLYPQRKR